MRKNKKLISMLLIGALSAGMLAGCGEKKQDAAVGEDGTFMPQEELELTIWNAQGTEHIQQETSTENIPKDWLEEKSMVKVANIYGNDGGQWDTKLSRLIAGDSMPDIVYVAAGQGPSHFKKLQDAKTLYPLTPELIQQYAPNVWERVPESCWELMTAENGEILGIPFGFAQIDEVTHPEASAEELAYMQKTNAQITYNGSGMYIRDDIAKMLYPDIKGFDELAAIIDETGKALDQAGIDNSVPINTTEDYIKMFRDIAALNLTEDGKKVFAFGYNGGDLWVPFTYLGASMYGYWSNNYITHWNPITKQIEAPLLGDVVKEAAKTQNMLIREGAFDPESLIQNNTSFKENCLNGLYAVTCLDYCGGLISVNQQLEQLGKDFRYIPLKTNVEPREDMPLMYYKAPWTAALTLTNKLDDNEVKQVLNWMNIQFSDEFEEIKWWGTPEDGLYTEENGVRRYVDERFNECYIDGNSAALPVADSKGIGSKVYSPEVEFFTMAGFYPKLSHWNPRVMQQIENYNSTQSTAYIPTTSDERVKQRPQKEVFDAPFAQIDECVEFWSRREQWESPFKIALGADTDESFEAQWAEAQKNFNEITDIQAMLDKMTEIAKKQAEDMGL